MSMMLRTMSALFAMLAVACVTYLLLVPPGGEGYYPRCLLYSTTGILCPGCGGTRAASSLLHGDIATAVKQNLLILLALPLAAVFWWSAVRFAVTGIWSAPTLRGRLGVAVCAVILLFMLLRNLGPFSFLRP